MATGSDKNIWFTERGAARIGKITPSGAIAEYAIPSGHSGEDIAPGASGTLWFTEAGSGIGKITTAGHITEFSLPGSQPYNVSIAKGSDGNMWFADATNAVIGNITPGARVYQRPDPFR